MPQIKKWPEGRAKLLLQLGAEQAADIGFEEVA